MTTRWLVTFSLVWLCACDGSPEPSDPTPSATTERFVISRLGLSMAVAPHYAVYQPREGEATPWVVDLNPGARGSHGLVLQPAGSEALERPVNRGPGCPWQGPREHDLRDGNHLACFTAVGCGGSGGVEAWLVGLWSIEDRRFHVSCSIQDEPSFGAEPDPEFCLDILRSARVVPATEAPVRLGPTGSSQSPLLNLLGAP